MIWITTGIVITVAAVFWVDCILLNSSIFGAIQFSNSSLVALFGLFAFKYFSYSVDKQRIFPEGVLLETLMLL
jgi:hypothetical protein